MAAPLAKPTIDEVVDYARDQIKIFLNKLAPDLPREQKDEISQRALQRIVQAYARLDPEKGWKAFTQTHCRGAVLDYIREGAGFEETAGDPRKDEKRKANDDELAKDIAKRCSESLRTRVSMVSDDDRSLDVEEIAGIHGIFAEDPEFEVDPNWNLVARMASVDEDIHLVAKVLLGRTQESLSEMFGVTRERLSQRVQEFVERLDAPEFYHNRWVRQTIFAFGLSGVYGMDKFDEGLGYEFEPVDLLKDETVNPQASAEFLAQSPESRRPDYTSAIPRAADGHRWIGKDGEEEPPTDCLAEQLTLM
jgi:DNA-directed RNA polymerase specialized sigma24 family protein